MSNRKTKREMTATRKQIFELLRENNKWNTTQQVNYKIHGDSKKDYAVTRKCLFTLLEEGKVKKIRQRPYFWKIAEAYADSPRNKVEHPKTDTVYGIKGKDTYELRNVLKHTGFEWAADKKAWVTTDKEVADKFVKDHSNKDVHVVEFDLKDNQEKKAKLEMELPGIKADTKADFGLENPATKKQIGELLTKINNLEDKLKAQEEDKPKRIIIEAPNMPKVETEKEEFVHPIFEQVWFHISMGENVMLIGPRGCGKTYLAKFIAEKLERQWGLLSLSGGVTESKLFGKSVPNVTTGENVFHPAPFTKLFQDGGLFLLDEVDAGDPNVLLSLNCALENNELAVDTAGDDLLVQRHNDNIVMAAANTWGTGFSRQYCGRNQLDGAFTARFTQIEMDYDPALERNLCKSQIEMVKTLQHYRSQVYKARLEREVSTRFMLKAAKWMDHGKDMNYVESMLFAGWKQDEVKKVKMN